MAPFLGGEVEHEIPGKAFQVSLDGLHQDSGLDLVERGQMSADHDFLLSNDVDAVFGALGGG